MASTTKSVKTSRQLAPSLDQRIHKVMLTAQRYINQPHSFLLIPSCIKTAKLTTNSLPMSRLPLPSPPTLIIRHRLLEIDTLTNPKLVIRVWIGGVKTCAANGNDCNTWCPGIARADFVHEIKASRTERQGSLRSLMRLRVSLVPLLFWSW